MLLCSERKQITLLQSHIIYLEPIIVGSFITILFGAGTDILKILLAVLPTLESV